MEGKVSVCFSVAGVVRPWHPHLAAQLIPPTLALRLCCLPPRPVMRQTHSPLLSIGNCLSEYLALVATTFGRVPGRARLRGPIRAHIARNIGAWYLTSLQVSFWLLRFSPAHHVLGSLQLRLAGSHGEMRPGALQLCDAARECCTARHHEKVL